MQKKYILALDQGTGSSRAVLFNKKTEVVGIEQQEIKQIYPKAGWVEHNPAEIWESQLSTAKMLLNRFKVSPDEIAGIGITNQRETTLVWEKRNGKPIYNAVVWQDKRTHSICNNLKEQGLESYVREKTGLLIDSYFSGTKLSWILENVDGAKEKAEKGELLFGTVDTWLLWKLTNGNVHATDYSNASRTMLFDINDLKWDDDLIDILNINKNMLPEVKNSCDIYGHTSEDLFGKQIPIGGIAGDQQAALFGQLCFLPGEAKNTYGTGCFMLMNTGNKPVRSNSGLLTTIAWGFDNMVTYALEGSVFIAGAAVRWLRDGLKIINSAADVEELIKTIKTNEGLYFVPAFTGLGAPYWNMNARGIIVGITQGITEKHLIRATLESMAYQTKDILDVMVIDSGIELKELYVDGGASVNDFLMQFQADILRRNVVRPEFIETTASGAAFLAGLSTGFWTTDDLANKRLIDTSFQPKMNESEVADYYLGWKKAVQKCIAGE